MARDMIVFAIAFLFGFAVAVNHARGTESQELQEEIPKTFSQRQIEYGEKNELRFGSMPLICFKNPNRFLEESIRDGYEVEWEAYSPRYRSKAFIMNNENNGHTALGIVYHNNSICMFNLK